ncbi:MAG: hypothetical protein AB1744_01815, partial [Candidatus Zixiibacteriota bacterium]
MPLAKKSGHAAGGDKLRRYGKLRAKMSGCFVGGRRPVVVPKDECFAARRGWACPTPPAVEGT